MQVMNVKNVKAIKEDLEKSEGSGAYTGRLIANIIAHYDELKDVSGWEIVHMFGLQPGKYPEVSKAKSAAAQLVIMGYEVTEATK